MKKLRTFFHCFYKSIASPKYYLDILKTKPRFTVKYYVVLTLLAALITTLAISVRIFPIAKQDALSFSQQIKNLYPSDLTITLKDGQWTANKPEPVIIPFPKPSGSELGDFENLAVFYKKGTVDDLKTYKTLVLVNETNVVVTDPSGTITSRPIKNFKDMEITADSINKFSDMILKYTPYFLITILALRSAFFYLIGNISSIFFVGIAVYVFAKSNKKNLKFVEALRIGAHTITIPIVLQVIIESAGFALPSSYWFFALNLILALVVAMKLPVSKLEAKTPSQLNTQN
ncbi:MAG: DUF1189 family protein [Patescibacteria group bacterium]|nr:DUF1189 domain-containing protein [Patescibacteria group bacterium]MBU1953222.1 DUF1189 domain-containing protein [Patescibacteria group bacterium]